MEKPTWKNTLYSNHNKGHSLDDLVTVAREWGYPYIEWNGRILLVWAGEMYRVGKSPDFPVCNAEELAQAGGVVRWCGGLRPVLQDIKLMAHDTLRAGTTLSKVFNGHLASALMAIVWPDTGDVAAAIEASLSALDNHSLRGSDPDGTIFAAITALHIRIDAALRLCKSDLKIDTELPQQQGQDDEESQNKGANIAEIQKRAGRESAKVALEMGLEPGDEVAAGDRAWTIVKITDNGVTGVLISEHGHFVTASSLENLDLRKRGVGWSRLIQKKSPVGSPA